MFRNVEIKSERTGHCRICQCFEDENMFDMLQGFKEVIGNEDILQSTCESFTSTTGIEVCPDDERSRFVCEQCFTRLKDFLLLRQEAKASRQKFTQIQDSPINESDSYLEEIVKVKGEETQKQCLICMGYDDDMTDVFTEVLFELDVDKEKKLRHIFKEIFEISPSDYAKSDKLLCGRCVNRLIDSHTFRHQAIKIDESSTEKPVAEDMIEIKQETFNCQFCRMEFTDQLDYETHLPCTNQTMSDRPYTCPDCGKSFDRYAAQKQHQLLHSDERPHVCSICSKTFKDRANFSRHLRVHSDKRPYACKMCPKTFKLSGILKHHLRTHNDKKEFVCHICSKAFKEFWNLKEHARVHSTDRPFICKVCSKSFKYSSILNAHILNVHEANRPYPCPSCPKAFSTRQGLRQHSVTHENCRPYCCKVCLKSFIYPSSLRKHNIIKHSNEHSE